MDKSSKRVVYKAKFFEVQEEEFVTPDGKIHLRSNVFRKPVSVVFPISEKEEIFLIKQYRRLFSAFILEAPAGHADSGESALETAKRELKEETGITAEKWEKLLEVDMAASVIKSVSCLFIAKNLKFGEQNLEESEKISVVKVDLKEALNKVFSGDIKNSATIIGILLLDKLSKEKKL